MKKVFPVCLIIVVCGLLLVGCPKPDLFDANENGIDDRTETLSPRDKEELNDIVRYYFHDSWADDVVLTQRMEIFNELSIDTQNIWDMSSLFSYDEYFNGNIGNWVTTNVTDMSSMFENATQFNQEIRGWKIGYVTDMSYMFSGAEAFYQDLSDWDVTGKDTYNMFQGTRMEDYIAWHPQGCQCRTQYHSWD